MLRPRLLDLFCGQGGAAKGYQAAGFDVTGVDRANHGKRYPGDFVQADALAYLIAHGHEYDAIHASPPCQGYTIATAGNPEARAKHQRLIAASGAPSSSAAASPNMRPHSMARYERRGGYVPRSIRVQQQLLGIDWMTVKGMQESIPPAYAQHVGMQLMAHVLEVAA